MEITVAALQSMARILAAGGGITGYVGAIAQEREILDSASTGDDNTPFTSSEKEYVRSAVDEIREYLITAHNFDRAIVEPQLKYLVESSERVGRKDWKNLLFATMVSLVISAYAPPETIREIFRFVGTVLRNLLHQPILLQ